MSDSLEQRDVFEIVDLNHHVTELLNYENLVKNLDIDELKQRAYALGLSKVPLVIETHELLSASGIYSCEIELDVENQEVDLKKLLCNRQFVSYCTDEIQNWFCFLDYCVLEDTEDIAVTLESLENLLMLHLELNSDIHLLDTNQNMNLVLSSYSSMRMISDKLDYCSGSIKLINLNIVKDVVRVIDYFNLNSLLGSLHESFSTKYFEIRFYLEKFTIDESATQYGALLHQLELGFPGTLGITYTFYISTDEYMVCEFKERLSNVCNSNIQVKQWFR